MNLKTKCIAQCLIGTLILTGHSVCLGQNEKVVVAKINCTYNKDYLGEKIIIRYQDGSTNIKSTNDYWLDSFITLSDSIKIIIIGKLLEYQNDSAFCCLKLMNWNFGGGEGCKSNPQNDLRYTIQIDALYMINRLCWPKEMDFYSCSPTLYDLETKRVINNDPMKVELVYAEYKRWFAECKLKGYIPRYFPFNEGRYVWYGGRKDVFNKE